ncbi:MAG: hypothetical protein AUK48_10795 [Oscillatoriales cyanobacterium CG2_30_44_21]|nr:MAG: hypothetical protein AUK48_10795 [Oscillatoriales cyanobacterium CG2_30_44_21]
MAVKLTLDDKQEILRLYRESEATTTYLAKQFGVSTSTVLRLLQELIPTDEYRQLVSQKKADGKRGSRNIATNSSYQVSQLAFIPDSLPLAFEDESLSLALEFEQDFEEKVDEGGEIAIAMDEDSDSFDQEDLIESPDEIDPDDQELDDDDLDDEDDLVDEDNLDLDQDELDFNDEDGESSLTMFAELHSGHAAGDHFEILPLDRADLPMICYIVVDRIAEIITRPLKDFKDLGAIPNEETLSKTIPIFDNHRVAKRFSHHNQRVIKFPSSLIHITRPQLIQKGITRILFDGQVYALNL